MVLPVWLPCKWDFPQKEKSNKARSPSFRVSVPNRDHHLYLPSDHYRFSPSDHYRYLRLYESGSMQLRQISLSPFVHSTSPAITIAICPAISIAIFDRSDMQKLDPLPMWHTLNSTGFSLIRSKIDKSLTPRLFLPEARARLRIFCTELGKIFCITLASIKIHYGP